MRTRFTERAQGWTWGGRRRGTQGIGSVGMGLVGLLFRAGPWLIGLLLALSLGWSLAKTEGQITAIDRQGHRYQLTVETEAGPRAVVCDAFFCRFLEVGDCVVFDRIWDTGRDPCR